MLACYTFPKSVSRWDQVSNLKADNKNTYLKCKYEILLEHSEFC